MNSINSPVVSGRLAAIILICHQTHLWSRARQRGRVQVSEVFVCTVRYALVPTCRRCSGSSTSTARPSPRVQPSTTSGQRPRSVHDFSSVHHRIIPITLVHNDHSRRRRGCRGICPPPPPEKNSGHFSGKYAKLLMLLYIKHAFWGKNLNFLPRMLTELLHLMVLTI